MKKAILTIAAVLATVSYADGFNVKAGLNYDVHMTKFGSKKAPGFLIEAEYSKKVKDINDKLSFDVAGGLDLSVGFTKVKHKAGELKNWDDIDRQYLLSIGYYGLKAKLKNTDNEDYTKEFLLEKAEIVKNLPEHNNEDSTGAYKLITQIEEKTIDLDYNDLKDKEKTLKAIDEYKGAYFTEGLTINNGKKTITKESIKQAEKALEEKVTIINTEAYVLPKLVYKVNDDVKVSLGVKTGLGMETVIYHGNGSAGKGMESLKPKFKIKSDKKEKSEMAAEFNEYYSQHKGMLTHKFTGNDFTENGYLVNPKVKTTWDKSNVYNFEIKKSVYHQLVIPVYGVVGFDYKHLKTTVEVGGKFRPKSMKKFNFGMRLNVGYEF